MRVWSVAKCITDYNLYFHRILYGLWWQQALECSKTFQLHHKDFCERCNTGTNPATACISAFSNMLDFSDPICPPRKLKLAHQAIPTYAPINELLSCVVLLVFPLYKFTSGPVMDGMPVRAEYLFHLSVLQLSLLQGCLAMAGMSLTEIKIIKWLR